MMRLRTKDITQLGCAVAFTVCAQLAAQLPNGSFLAATSGTTANRGFFVVDRFAGTSTKLVVAGFPFSTVTIHDTFIEDNKNFLVAVESSTTTGDVYRVSWVNNSWSATRLTTQSTSPRVTSVTRIGNFVYASGGSAGNGSTNDNMIWIIPAAGGNPVAYVKHGRKFGGPAYGTGGPMVAVGTDLHVFMWNAPATGGEHWAIDTTKTPPAPRLVGGLMPGSKRYTCRAIALLPIGATFDPDAFGRTGGAFVIGGRLGDVLVRSLTGQNIQHDFVPATTACSTAATDLLNALAVNTDTGAVLAGDSDRTLEERICDTDSWQLNAVTLGASANTTVVDLEYVSGGVEYRKVGNGCNQSSGGVACSYVNSLPLRGNNSFAFTLESTSAAAVLILGGSQFNINLGNYGAPGCWIGPRADILLASRTTANGFSADLPVPTALKPLTAFTQWIQVDRAANQLGLVVSDTRRLKL